MKRTRENTSSSFEPAITKPKLDSPHIFSDSMFCVCPSCGSPDVVKPAFSMIATEWRLHNDMALPETSCVRSTSVSNVYKLKHAHVPQQFINTFWCSVLTVKNSKQIANNVTMPLMRTIPRSLAASLVSPAELFHYRTVEETLGIHPVTVGPPGSDIEMENGSSVVRSRAFHDVIGDATASGNYLNFNNESVTRLGDMLLLRAVQPLDYLVQSVLPVNSASMPLHCIFTAIHDKICVSSSRWFHQDFYDRNITDPLVELNSHPDYVARGLVDVYRADTSFVRTRATYFEGVIEDKPDFLATTIGRDLYSNEQLRPLYEKRLRDYDSAFTSVLGNDSMPNHNDTTTQLMLEIAFQIGEFDGEYTLDKKHYKRYLLDTFNIYHSPKNVFTVPGYLICDTEPTSHTHEKMFIVTPENFDSLKVDFVIRGAEWLRKQINDYHTFTFVKWFGTRAETKNSQLPQFKLYLKKSGDSWGTHKVFCRNCWKTKKDLLDLNSMGGTGNPAAAFDLSPPNYNFFFEMYRALPMKLRPSIISERYNDLDIVCQQ